MPDPGGFRGHFDGHRLPWGVVILMLATITSSSLSVLSMYHVLALQVEVEVLQREVVRRREVQRWAPEETSGAAQTQLQQKEQGRKETEDYSMSPPPSTSMMDDSKQQHGQPHLQRRSLGGESVLQSCLQLMADNKRTTSKKMFRLEPHTSIPWQMGLRRGSALEEDKDKDTILVKEEGFFFIYSQVYYTDPTFAMGHIVIRKKRNIVGDEGQHVILFRCIQAMNTVFHYNTCYTGGIVKLEVGDKVELLIPRPTASISLDGDSTFLGAIKLG